MSFTSTSSSPSISSSTHLISSSFPTHLFILLHGIHGKTSDLDYLVAKIRDEIPNADPYLITSNCTSLLSTHAGIDCGGKRAAEEVVQYVEKRRLSGPPHTHLSVIGHSLGGMYARYMIGYLYQHHHEWWNQMEKRVFMTLATPHLGSLQHYRRAPSFLFSSNVAEYFVKLMTGRSGIQQMLADEKENHDGIPLLVHMVRPPYITALSQFAHRIIYANISGDYQVHYTTAAIRVNNPYRALTLASLPRLSQYPHIIDYHQYLEKHYNTTSTSTSASTCTSTSEVEDEHEADCDPDTDNKLDEKSSTSTSPSPSPSTSSSSSSSTAMSWYYGSLPPVSSAATTCTLPSDFAFPRTISSNPWLREMYTSLSSIPFHRFDIVGRFFWGHTDIVVKSERWNGEGIKIVAHMIEQIKQAEMK